MHALDLVDEHPTTTHGERTPFPAWTPLNIIGGSSLVRCESHLNRGKKDGNQRVKTEYSHLVRLFRLIQFVSRWQSESQKNIKMSTFTVHTPSSPAQSLGPPLLGGVLGSVSHSVTIDHASGAWCIAAPNWWVFVVGAADPNREDLFPSAFSSPEAGWRLRRVLPSRPE